MNIKEYIMHHPALKRLAHWALKPRNRYHPRWWVKVFVNPFKHSRGRHSIVSGRTRMDVMPYNKFDLGADSVIESFATVNNAVGDVIIGDRTLIGISDVVIGPVTIGNDVLLAQHVVLSGLNHSYQDIHTPISKQSYSTALIIVEDGVWIGANAVITAGVTIGRNSVIAAGSVVTRDVPPFSVAAGNPAKVLKQYNPATETWDKVSALRLVP